VAADEEARAIITVADGRFWSFGLDLDSMAEHPDEIQVHLLALHELCARLLELPIVSVAAIQGHAFAATLDQRLVGRGWRCGRCTPREGLPGRRTYHTQRRLPRGGEAPQRASGSVFACCRPELRPASFAWW
jgi:Enoyl-CoA hydratase/isomerase